MTTAISFEPYLLTPLDHTIPQCYLSYFLSFRLKDPENSLPALQTGMKCLVSALPFLAGDLMPSNRLAGKQRVFEIQPPTTTSLKEIPIFQVKYHLHCILPHNSYGESASTPGKLQVANFDASFSPLSFMHVVSGAQPIFRVQANVMADGVILCICTNHIAMDATGTGTVIETLAGFCRARLGEPVSVPTTPEDEADSRKRIFEAIAAPYERRDHKEEYCPMEILSTLSQKQVAEFFASAAQILTSRDFIFPSKKIQWLKDTCNALLPQIIKRQSHTNGHNNMSQSVNGATNQWFVSSNDVLVALLWLCMNRARFPEGRSTSKQPSPNTTLIMAVNARQRLHPSLSKAYLGNAVVSARASYNLEALCAGNSNGNIPEAKTNGIDNGDLLVLTDLAFQIRSKLAVTDDAHIRSAISWILDCKDWGTILTAYSDSVASNWRHIKVYQSDFGPHLGRIENFDTSPGMVEGECIIKPERTPENLGARSGKVPWEVQITLKRTQIENLGKDKLFSWASETEKSG
ncbi:MAG: hypothetical protein M1834_007210 [Cirrosporium novae-zelandiae]|nr:MAG: hypothetical protein M1834_007210 [Cirrosporium novae-zelandiae]